MPDTSELEDVARLTFVGSSFEEVIDILQKILRSRKQKDRRRLLKALKVVDFCLGNGSEQFVTWAQQHVYLVSALENVEISTTKDKDLEIDGMCPHSEVLEY
jgi:epsin